MDSGEPRLRIRNWQKFQHYQYRNPPWIKLYRELLDDPEWHALSGESAKGLIMLWLIASEDEGFLPASTTLAFRLRISENRIIALLSECSNWFEQNASNVLAERYQDAIPETESETETEKSREEHTPVRVHDFSTPAFNRFWQAYPVKLDRRDAIHEWHRTPFADKSIEEILSGLAVWKASDRWSEERYIPAPAKFLKMRRWESMPPKKGLSKHEERRRKTKEAIASVFESGEKMAGETK